MIPRPTRYGFVRHWRQHRAPNVPQCSSQRSRTIPVGAARCSSDRAGGSGPSPLSKSMTCSWLKAPRSRPILRLDRPMGNRSRQCSRRPRAFDAGARPPALPRLSIAAMLGAATCSPRSKVPPATLVAGDSQLSGAAAFATWRRRISQDGVHPHKYSRGPQ